MIGTPLYTTIPSSEGNTVFTSMISDGGISQQTSTIDEYTTHRSDEVTTAVPVHNTSNYIIYIALTILIFVMFVLLILLLLKLHAVIKQRDLYLSQTLGDGYYYDNDYNDVTNV